MQEQESEGERKGERGKERERERYGHIYKVMDKFICIAIKRELPS